jgi:hypothetical protein
MLHGKKEEYPTKSRQNSWQKVNLLGFLEFNVSMLMLTYKMIRLSTFFMLIRISIYETQR